jgi:neprilysin
LDQLELALPGRDYYLKKNSENEIKAYHKYMTEVAQLLGAKPETASEELSKVLHLERRLANVSSHKILPNLALLYGARGRRFDIWSS